MPTSLATNASTLQLRLLLSDEVINDYQAQADALHIRLEDLLARRLTASVDHTSSKALYFDDRDRSELEQLLGKNILNTKDVLTLIRSAMTVRIHNLKVVLKPAILTRLKTRCLGMEWEKFIEQRVVQALEQYVGMR